MALNIEGVEDSCMCRQESLGRSRTLEALHLAFPSPRWLMRSLRSIVLPLAPLVAGFESQITSRGAVGSQIVRHQPIWDHRVFLEKLAHQFQRGRLVALGLKQNVENLAFGVDCAPKVSHLAVDLQIHFIKMPNRVGLG